MRPGQTMCPRYHAAIELLGKRWTGLLVRALLGGPRRFSELTADLDGISERVLSERLKELEAEGVVRRVVEGGPPVKVEYRLTAKGQDLSGVVGAIAQWAEAWVEPPSRASALEPAREPAGEPARRRKRAQVPASRA